MTAVLASVITAGALLATPTLAEAAPPPNPTNGQINAAAAAKSAAANLVGQLSAQVAQQQAEVQASQAASELAEQKQVYAMEQLQIAQAKAQQAQQQLKTARAKVVDAQRRFTAYVQATYMSGTLDDETGILLTATDPSAMLSQSTLRDYQATHQLNAVGDMQRATVAVSNAEAHARQTLKQKGVAEVAAKQAAAEALQAYQANIEQQKLYESQLSATRTKLAAAQLQLATLNNQRAKYLAYQAEQRRIAAAKAAAEAAARRRAALLAAQQANNSGNGNGGGGNNTGPAPVPTGGSWTAQKGRDAVARALHYVGWMYAWAGGNSSGPTRGLCAGDGAWNDCNIVGFDCSGLTLYGWAPYTYLAHWTVNQYLYGGSYRPSMNSLLPGDLVFWSNGGVSGIHHVAMYIGGGQIVEAPESGVPIRTASLWEYGQPFGTVRPLT